MPDVMSGVVKWYNKQQGFGFISPDAGGPDVFVQSSNINPMYQFRGLEENQKVTFTMQQSAKGFIAKNVDLL